LGYTLWLAGALQDGLAVLELSLPQNIHTG
jgi:hypothetical protein